MTRVLSTTLAGILTAFSCGHVRAQEPLYIEWQRSLGGSGVDNVTQVLPTSDGGLLVVGVTRSDDGDVSGFHGGFHAYDIWVVRTDAQGEILWQRCLGGSGHERARDAVCTASGQIVIVGSTRSTNGDVVGGSGDQDSWAVCLSAEGELLWQYLIQGDYDGPRSFEAVVEKSDGNLVLTESVCLPGGFCRAFILELTPPGTEVWRTRLFQGDSFLQLVTADLAILLDGSYGVVAGDVGDVMAAHVLPNGEIHWEQGYLSSEVTGRRIIASSDGGIVLTFSGGGNAGVTKVNMTNPSIREWTTMLSGQSGITGIRTTDGNYLTVGMQAEGDASIVAFDQAGSILSQVSFGGSESEQQGVICEPLPGRFVFACNSNSNDGDVSGNHGDYDIWLVGLGSNANVVEGSVFNDLNANGIHDVDEPAVVNHVVVEPSTGRFTITGANGSYYMRGFDVGTTTIQATSLPHYISQPSAHEITFTGPEELLAGRDFALTPLVSGADLSISVVPMTAFRPGFTCSYQLTCRNLGTTPAMPTVVMTPDAELDLLSAYPLPTSTSPEIVWQLPELAALGSTTIYVSFEVPSSTVLGTTLIAIANAGPTASDLDPSNNVQTSTVTVTGAYDPNDIRVLPTEILVEEIADLPSLDYLIRFQNTGTDTAFHVRVKNVVSERVVPGSFRNALSSHPMEVHYSPEENAFWFEFKNILLPDSGINEIESHGYVRFQLDPATGLVLGDSILSHAEIFFDYNAPVITNRASTVVVNPTSTSDIPRRAAPWFQVLPNPTDGMLELRFTGRLQQGQIHLIDNLGRVVLATGTTLERTLLDLSGLPAGIYAVSVSDGDRAYTQRVVLE